MSLQLFGSFPQVSTLSSRLSELRGPLNVPQVGIQRSVAAARAGTCGVNAAVPSSRPRFCAMNTQPCFKALSGIGRMCRFGGTAGVVLIRFRGFEDRIRTLAAAGRWLCCALPTDLGCRRSCSPRRRSYILPMPLDRPSSRATARSSRYWHHIAGGAAGVFALRIC
jgi:hypothetical protein